MSYLKKIKYEIVLKDSFLVIRGCPKCGRKFLLYLRKNIRVFWTIMNCLRKCMAEICNYFGKTNC